MNWQEPSKLAIALRDQGLADCIAARRNLRLDTYVILGRETNLAHVVVAKCQQSVEKLVKGYILWHDGSFDPAKGHTPFCDALGKDKRIDALCVPLNRINPRVVRELKWLEGLAPRLPELPLEARGNRIPLHQIAENSEYPFWSPVTRSLCTPADGLTMRGHATRAVNALRSLMRVLAASDPPGYTKGVREFLEEHPFSTAATAAETQA